MDPSTEGPLSDPDVAIAIIREWEARMRADPLFSINPFQRSGITASEVAWGAQWIRPEMTRSGRPQADVPRARRALKALLACGEIVSLGRSRTLAAGSKSVEVFCTPSFRESLDSLHPRSGS